MTGLNCTVPSKLEGLEGTEPAIADPGQDEVPDACAARAGSIVATRSRPSGD